MWTYVNGDWLPSEEARVSVADRALRYGLGLFETMLVTGGRVPLLERHLGRLYASCPVLGIPFGIGEGDVGAVVAEAVVAEAVARNDIQEGVARLMVTAGVEGGTPGFIVTCRAGKPYDAVAYERGFAGVWAVSRRNHLSPLARVKSLNFGDSYLEWRRALEAGADEAIFLNVAGELAEGSVTNLFLVRGSRLLTPAVGCGALPGIARGMVIEGEPVEEGRLRADDLEAADEAFLTNALLGIMPLVRLGGRAIGDGRPGPLTSALRARYERRLRER